MGRLLTRPAAAALAKPASAQSVSTANEARQQHRSDGPYDFDQYQGRLYRIFEGTVLEGVVTNHIDGGFSGPILVMLTTDYYSHDHQQLLMPQGTRLIGTVQSVGNAQQRKMFVTFHRAICPDGFSLDFDKYIGLDQIGTTGLATKVNHGYFQAFAAAAAIGGLGGLAQIGNNGSVLDPSTQIRNGISAQSAAEGEQVLNHFLNRLPVITLKEGSRARVYIGRDILIPSYAEHRVDPTLSNRYVTSKEAFMKFNMKQSSQMDIGGAALSAHCHAELRTLRHRRHRLRSHQLRQPRLPAHHAGDAVQHAQEQHRAFFAQAAMADHASMH